MKIRIIKAKDYVPEEVEIWMKTVDVREWSHIYRNDKIYPDNTYVIKYEIKN